MSAELNQALQSAKYNELVEVQVSDGETTTRNIVLTATLDQESGGTQWIDASSNGDLLRRHLRTKRWIFPMLNDTTRNDLYDKAIRRASEMVAKRVAASREDTATTTTPATIHSLDIGSGTGLLAMLTAKYLKENCKAGDLLNVASLEMSSAMSKMATMIVASNELSDQVHVVEGHSCEIPPLEPKAEMCTSELLDSGLLGEGWLPAMRDAWERHLSPTATVVPQGARVYAQIVESGFLSNFWGPYRSAKNFSESRSLRLCISQHEDDVLLSGGVMLPMHINLLKDDIRVLSDPILAVNIDVSSKQAIPSPGSHQSTTEFVPIADGRAQAVMFWWELDLFGDDLTYTTHPQEGPWQDHWQQCVFVFGKQKDQCLELNVGEAASLIARHDDTSLSFDVVRNINENGPHAKRPKTDLSKNSAHISPERAWQLNDTARTEALVDGIRSALETKGSDTVVLDLSDFSLCAMIAALLGATKVTSLETSSSQLPEMTARIAQIGNGLPLKQEEKDQPENVFQIVRCHAEQLTRDILGGVPAGIIVAEPYYEILEGWHLQEALNYFHTVRALKRRGVLSDGAISVPAYAKVMVSAFESSDLLGAYHSCDPKLCGFGHDPINQHCRFSEQDIALPTWQYDIKEITEPLEIATIDFETCATKDDFEASTTFTSGGICSGIMIWIEYRIRVGGQIKILSTKSRPCSQTIRMLPQKVLIADDSSRPMDASICCRAKLDDINQVDQDYLVVNINQER